MYIVYYEIVCISHAQQLQSSCSWFIMYVLLPIFAKNFPHLIIHYTHCILCIYIIPIQAANLMHYCFHFVAKFEIISGQCSFFKTLALYRFIKKLTTSLLTRIRIWCIVCGIVPADPLTWSKIFTTLTWHQWLLDNWWLMEFHIGSLSVLDACLHQCI